MEADAPPSAPAPGVEVPEDFFRQADVREFANLVNAANKGRVVTAKQRARMDELALKLREGVPLTQRDEVADAEKAGAFTDELNPAKPLPRCTNAEAKFREATFIQWVTWGKRRGWMLREAAKRWRIGPRMVDHYTHKAGKIIQATHEKRINLSEGKIVSGYWEAYAIAHEAGDTAGMIDALDSIAKILGVKGAGVQKIEITGKDGAPVGLPAGIFAVPARGSENEQAEPDDPPPAPTP